MTPALRLLARIDEILATGKFANAQEWATRAGLSRSYLSTLRSRASTGEVSSIRADAVEALAKAAGMTVEDLLGAVKTAVSIERPHTAFLEALETVRWPGDMDPAVVSEVVRTAEAEAAKAPILPADFWVTRIEFLLAEARTAKSRTRAKAR